MSVLIRGMEMPRNCFECRFQDMEFCHAYHDHSGDAEYIPDDILDVSRPDWCPLAKIPDHHGRLIDADSVIDNLAKAIPYYIDDSVTIAYVEGINRARIEIDDASIVIEPEDEE